MRSLQNEFLILFKEEKVSKKELLKVFKTLGYEL